MHTSRHFCNAFPQIPGHYLEGTKSATATNRSQNVINGAQGSRGAELAASTTKPVQLTTGELMVDIGQAAQPTYTAEQTAAAMRIVQFCRPLSLNVSTDNVTICSQSKERRLVAVVACRLLKPVTNLSEMCFQFFRHSFCVQSLPQSDSMQDKDLLIETGIKASATAHVVNNLCSMERSPVCRAFHSVRFFNFMNHALRDGCAFVCT